MALSEHEQKMLAEMERALYAEDPRFASSIREANLGNLRSAKTGLLALVTLAGIAAIVSAMAIQQPLLGVLGFIAVLAGLYGIVTAVVHSRTEGAPQPSRRKAARKAGFIERAEERFRDRRDGNSGH